MGGFWWCWRCRPIPWTQALSPPCPPTRTRYSCTPEACTPEACTPSCLATTRPAPGKRRAQTPGMRPGSPALVPWSLDSLFSRLYSFQTVHGYGITEVLRRYYAGRVLGTKVG
ncbi:hypothetical protein B484DRAFT_456548 [Ochromonadaceae sp. CCMP2298]|nr:hypothetical protein B484DRAFT_456548 [Ochromonadaceae sp. CCMP2298]